MPAAVSHSCAVREHHRIRAHCSRLVVVFGNCSAAGPDRLERMSRGILQREAGAIRDSLDEFFGEL